MRIRIRAKHACKRACKRMDHNTTTTQYLSLNKVEYYSVIYYDFEKQWKMQRQAVGVEFEVYMFWTNCHSETAPRRPFTFPVRRLDICRCEWFNIKKTFLMSSTSVDKIIVTSILFIRLLQFYSCVYFSFVYDNARCN